MTVNLPGDPSIIAGMKPGFFFEANAFLAGCGFETQSRTNFNPDMGIAGLIASPRGDHKSAGLLEDQPGALRVARVHPQGAAALLVGAERAVPRRRTTARSSPTRSSDSSTTPTPAAATPAMLAESSFKVPSVLTR